MRKIEILDGTLRDGGYINNWIFQQKNIDMIYEKLLASNVDYIELGYIDENAKVDLNSTKFNSFEATKNIDSSNKNICMIDFGKFSIDKVPKQNETNIHGIRVAFSKKDLKDAINYCKIIKEKGYDVYIQPMVTISYSEKELELLLNLVNNIEPYAVYIVDSFGSMNEKNVIEVLNKYKKSLKEKIKIGFHAHNNLQLAYSNAITFMNNSDNRDIIIDSSVYGIGRGAGNLATELISSYLNNKDKQNYRINYILEIVDNYLLDLKKIKNWGYCLEYYLSAINNCHPNYSKFLSEMHTMTIYDMQSILEKISDEKKNRFDKTYIHEIYTTYMNKKIDDEKSYKKLKTILKNKKVFLFGSGNTLNSNKEKIKNKIEKNTIIISVNDINLLYDCDYIFISNKRRFKSIKNVNMQKVICTSNIDDFNSDNIVFNYFDNLATEYDNSDNALLILLNILIKADIKKVYLAGFDGFSYKNVNYYNNDLDYFMEKESIEKVNDLMSKYLELYNKKIKINWLTDSNYIRRK